MATTCFDQFVDHGADGDAIVRDVCANLDLAVIDTPEKYWKWFVFRVIDLHAGRYVYSKLKKKRTDLLEINITQVAPDFTGREIQIHGIIMKGCEEKKNICPDCGCEVDLTQLQRCGAAGVNTSPERQADGWQPIETAPKDGNPILVFAQGVQTVVFWRKHFIQSDDKDHGWWQLVAHDHFSGDPAFMETPTHWQTLPKAPEVGS